MTLLDDLPKDLCHAGIIITVEGDAIRWRAPGDSMTTERLAALGFRKPEILYLFNDRAEAERRANRQMTEGQDRPPHAA